MVFSLIVDMGLCFSNVNVLNYMTIIKSVFTLISDMVSVFLFEISHF